MVYYENRKKESELQKELNEKKEELIQRELELIRITAQSILEKAKNDSLTDPCTNISSNYSLYNLEVREKLYNEFLSKITSEKNKHLCSLFWEYYYRVCNYMRFSNAATYKENVHVLALLSFVFYYTLYIQNDMSEESFEAVDDMLEDLIFDCSLLHLFDLELFYSTKYFYRYMILDSSLFPRYDWLNDGEKLSDFVKSYIPLKSSSVFCDIIINKKLAQSITLETDYFSFELSASYNNPVDRATFRKNVVPCVFNDMITLSDALHRVL